MSALVVTMAGKSRRFTELGVATPKWAIQIGGSTLAARAIGSMAGMLDSGWRLVLVALNEHIATSAWNDFIQGLPWSAEVVGLPRTLAGQALSAQAARELVSPSEPVAVWNADTLILPGPEPLFMPGGNWLTLTHADGDHWSFASMDEHGRVTGTAEKRRISENASIGLYGFSSMQQLGDLVDWGSHSEHEGVDELYIAPLYNRLIADGALVRGLSIPQHRLVPLGTPAEVSLGCRRLDWEIPAELASLGLLSDG